MTAVHFLNALPSHAYFNPVCYRHLMSTVGLPQNLPAPQAITDPKLVTSKPNAQVEQKAEPFHRKALHDARSRSDDLVARRQDISPSSPTSADATISGWCPPPVDGRRSSPSAISARLRRHGRPTASGSPTVRLRRRRAVGYFPGFAQDRAGGEPDQHPPDLPS